MKVPGRISLEEDRGASMKHSHVAKPNTLDSLLPTPIAYKTHIRPHKANFLFLDPPAGQFFHKLKMLSDVSIQQQPQCLHKLNSTVLPSNVLGSQMSAFCILVS